VTRLRFCRGAGPRAAEVEASGDAGPCSGCQVGEGSGLGSSSASNDSGEERPGLFDDVPAAIEAGAGPSLNTPLDIKSS
jgi:hypothetical protein